MRSFPALRRCSLPVASSLTALALVATAVLPATAEGAKPHPRPQPHAELFDTTLGYVQGTHKPQTSDGEANAIAQPLSPLMRAMRSVSPGQRWQVAPGVKATTFTDLSLRGPVREFLLAVDWRHRGVHLNVVNNGPVRDVGTVPSMVAKVRGVAGVNGDFYDIGDTGAPLGIAKSSSQGLLNGRLRNWNSAFYFDSSGRPNIGPLAIDVTVRQHPGLQVTNYNSPEVDPNGVGLYTPRFGPMTRRVVDSDTRHVRMVLVRDGRVVRNSIRIPSGSTVDGQLFIGRGRGARALAGLTRGERITVRTRLDGAPDGRPPRVALTGNHFLVRNGIIRVVDDREMAPRTAIGIDRDTHEILILAVDGRSRASRGMTMVELADQMIDLGADEALNLDGGGSTTMVARHHGSNQVINTPSDGFLRQVANGLVVTVGH